MTEELFREDAYAPCCEAAVTATLNSGVCQVVDTVKDGAQIVHRLIGGIQPPPRGARVIAKVDWPRRHRLMRMHSCLHLLCQAVDAATCHETESVVVDHSIRVEVERECGNPKGPSL